MTVTEASAARVAALRISDRIDTLRGSIIRHDTLYYAHGTPSVSDAVYDELFAELQQLEADNPALATDDSPTQRVGGEPIEGLTTVDHLAPMLSIDNGFDMGVLDKFHAKATKALGHDPDYVADWKIDGCALSLIYEDGKLTGMVSRGDGTRGDVLTHHAQSIRGVPPVLQRLPLKGLGKNDHMIKVDGIVEVRGEAYIPNTVFSLINTRRVSEGEEPFKNSRNATAGALRQLDPTECYRRGIHFVAHGIGRFDPEYRKDSFSKTLWGLHVRGIPVIGCPQTEGLPYRMIQKVIKGMELVLEHDGIDYPVDGIVLKLDKISDRIAMGQVSSRHVSWALAYKWERYEAETKIIKLEVQVGKQGTLTPVAYYEPVEIAETTVQKSTLFNFDEVARLDPRVGDTVTLEKAGKIIPHLVRVHKDKRVGKPRKFKPPATCPVCKGITFWDGVHVQCSNTTGCSAQLAAVILAAANRSRLDIDGLGPKAIQAMIASQAITDFASLWALPAVVAARGAKGAIPGMTPGKSKKLLAELEVAKTRPSWRLLASLNIKHCGRTNSEVICKAITTQAGGPVDVFKVLADVWVKETMMAVDGIGTETADALLAWLNTPFSRKLLTKLRTSGLNMGLTDPVAVVAPTGARPLDGKNVCATGKLVGFTRDSIKEAIITAGGKAASSVSKKTNYLIAGADAGSKLAKAEQLGVTVLNEEEFKELVGI